MKNSWNHHHNSKLKEGSMFHEFNAYIDEFSKRVITLSSCNSWSTWRFRWALTYFTAGCRGLNFFRLTEKKPKHKDIERKSAQDKSHQIVLINQVSIMTDHISVKVNMDIYFCLDKSKWSPYAQKHTCTYTYG